MSSLVVFIGDQTDSIFSTTVDGAATDPTAVTVKIEDGDGTETGYSGMVIALPAEIVRSSVGVFVHTFTPDVAGTWTLRWFSTGAVVKAEEDSITVRASRFTSPLSTA